MLQSAGSVIPNPTLFFSYAFHNDENLDDCTECLSLYHDLVRTDPEMAINLTDLLESGPGAVGQTDTAEAVPPITNANRQSNSLAEETSPSTNFASPTPPVDGPHDRRRYNYYCVVCGRPHDRAERARDCSNRDLGLTPHAFQRNHC